MSGIFSDILDAFEDAWAGGDRPVIDKYIAMLPESRSEDDVLRLLLELIEIDLEWRWRRASKPSGDLPNPTSRIDGPDGSSGSDLELSDRPMLQHYVNRYPTIGSIRALPTELIAREYRVLCEWGEPPGIEEFLARYRPENVSLREAIREVATDIGRTPNIEEQRDLVQRSISGDQAAIQELLFRNYEKLQRYINLHIPADVAWTIRAEDVVQATHIQVFRSIGTLEVRSDSTFSNWITAIADSLLADVISTVRKRRDDGT